VGGHSDEATFRAEPMIGPQVGFAHPGSASAVPWPPASQAAGYNQSIYGDRATGSQGQMGWNPANSGGPQASWDGNFAPTNQGQPEVSGMSMYADVRRALRTT